MDSSITDGAADADVTEDSAVMDSGAVDSAVVDSGAVDSGAVDSGTSCAVGSYAVAGGGEAGCADDAACAGGTCDVTAHTCVCAASRVPCAHECCDVGLDTIESALMVDSLAAPLMIDAASRPHVAYIGQASSGRTRLVHAVLEGGTWTRETVLETASGARPMGAVLGLGAGGEPFIFFDDPAGQLHLARRDAAGSRSSAPLAETPPRSALTATYDETLIQLVWANQSTHALRYAVEDVGGPCGDMVERRGRCQGR